MIPDNELLRRYAEGHDEAAFAELAQRHLPVVHSTALRLTGGNTQMAQDVASAAFTALARRAGVLTGHATIVGWLHTTTRNLAAKTVRDERRRHHREQEAVAMHEQQSDGQTDIELLRPLLDWAVGQLRDDERNALLLRFYQNKSHQEVADILGLKENTANKRIERALEKLRRMFARRGVTASTMLLVGALEAHAAPPLPAGVSALVTKTCLAKAAASGGLAHTVWNAIFMSTKTKTILITAAAVMAVAALPLTLQYREIAELQDTAAPKQPSAQSAISGTAKTTAMPGETLETLKGILALKDPLEMMQRLTSFVKGLDAASIPPMLNYLVQFASTGRSLGIDASNSKLALSMLLDRLVKLAPPKALAWAAAVPNRFGRNDLIAEVFAEWANINPSEALAQADQIEDPRLKESVIGGIVQALIATNPQEALAQLLKLPLNPMYASIVKQAFSAWASQDPNAAMAAAQSLPADRNRATAMQAAMQGWATVDAQGLLAWGAAQQDTVTKNQAVNLALSALSRQDPQQAIDYVESVRNVPMRNKLTIQVVSDWALDDPKAAAQWALDNVNGTTLKNAETAIMDPLSKIDPQAAADLLTKMVGGGGNQMNSITQIANNWAEVDPQADLNWLKYVNDASGNGSVSAFKGNTEASVVSTWASNDPDAALAYVESLGSTNSQFTKFIAAIATTRAAADPSTASVWLQSLPDDAARSAALNSVVTQLIPTDPQQAMTLAQQLPAGSAQDAAYGKIIGIWSEADPAAAAATLASLPDSDRQTSATGQIAASWIQSDAAAAAAWINTLPTGDARDAAAKEEVKTLAGVDSPNAMTWALSIGNITTRTQQARSVVQLWARSDATAATNAVESSTGLTDLGKSRMLTLIQRISAGDASAADTTSP